jgi:Xaa-Pro aminopeptidase
MIPIKSYSVRRQQLASQMQKGIAIIPTSPERIRSRDGHYPYRFDSYFYYLTGFSEPEAMLIMIVGNEISETRNILFCQDKDIEHEIWNGFRHGPESAKEVFNVDEAYPISTVDEMLPKLLIDQPKIYYALGQDTGWDLRLTGWLNQVREQSRNGLSTPAEICDSRMLVDEMRLFKSTEELQLMRYAAEISSGAHCRAMKIARPGMKEYEIEAEFLYEFRNHGAEAPAYTPIVAGGANACVLHYVKNNMELISGDLLLVDAGCELHGYAADITRTFPVNGKFNSVQKDIYQLVLSAQSAAISAVQPGNSWDMPHTAALKILVQGFIDLGLCHGSIDSVIESEDYRRFYMHRTGHWLGLDVHDVGEYKRDGKWRLFEPGMTLTVEPGCYIRPAENVPDHFWNIGVRIEDDVVVTSSGCEILSVSAPKSIDEIEELMR